MFFVEDFVGNDKNDIIFGIRIRFRAWTVQTLFSMASILTSIWLSFALWKVSAGISIKLTEHEYNHVKTFESIYGMLR